MTNKDLICKLKEDGVLKSPRIEKALLEVDRSDFVLPQDKRLAYYDDALSIGFGQTISQPFTVVFMLELLGTSEGHKVLDVGTGSGWQAGLLSSIVGDGGEVHTVEIVAGLHKFAKHNLSKYPGILKRIKLYERSASGGLPELKNGFDRIISAAAVETAPQSWLEQLRVGGKMVFPKDGGIYKVEKTSENDFDAQFFPGFMFVPFIEG